MATGENGCREKKHKSVSGTLLGSLWQATQNYNMVRLRRPIRILQEWVDFRLLWDNTTDWRKGMDVYIYILHGLTWWMLPGSANIVYYWTGWARPGGASNWVGATSGLGPDLAVAPSWPDTCGQQAGELRKHFRCRFFIGPGWGRA